MGEFFDRIPRPVQRRRAQRNGSVVRTIAAFHPTVSGLQKYFWYLVLRDGSGIGRCDGSADCMAGEDEDGCEAYYNALFLTENSTLAAALNSSELDDGDSAEPPLTPLEGGQPAPRGASKPKAISPTFSYVNSQTTPSPKSNRPNWILSVPFLLAFVISQHTCFLALSLAVYLTFISPKFSLISQVSALTEIERPRVPVSVIYFYIVF